MENRNNLFLIAQPLQQLG